jgi:hypothetical protein
MMRLPSVCLAVLLAAVPAAAQQPAAPADDEKWVPTEIMNLTVLPKETSPEDLVKIMRSWNEALNVGCVFCHVGTPGKPLSTFDFASDKKPRKEVSRVMLRATIAMNQSFKEIGDDPPVVQCSTCHKRARMVDADLPPPVPEDEPK